MGPWNSNMVHERDDCIVGRKVDFISEVPMKLSPLVSAGVLLALFLQGIPLIAPHI